MREVSWVAEKLCCWQFGGLVIILLSECLKFLSIETLFLRPSSQPSLHRKLLQQDACRMWSESLSLSWQRTGVPTLSEAGRQAGRSSSFSKYCYRCAMGRGRERGRDSFKCFFPSGNMNLNFELCFSAYIYIKSNSVFLGVIILNYNPKEDWIILHKQPVRTAQ